VRGTHPTLAGAGTLFGFALRRDRIRLPVWVLAGAALVVQQSLGSQTVYDTPQALAAYRASVGSNPATIALSGPPVGLDTVAGAIAFEISFSVILVAALMAMFTTVRHTRGDEEAGRTELIRSAQVGRHAPLAAAVGVAAVGCVGMTLLIGAVGTATGLPTGGSFLLGGSIGAAGLVFTGITAVCAQISASARATYGLVLAVFGVAFAVRAVGDIEGNALVWASPIGWAQAAHPFSDDRGAPLLLCVVATAGLLAGARALLDHRDLGAGMLETRPGPAAAARSLGSPLGLAWRLQRGSVLSWAVGLVLLGALYGGLADAVETLLADNPEASSFFPEASTAGLVDAYLGLTLVMVALLTTAFAVSSVLRARGEEAAGRVEPLLATATSRAAWLGSHGTVAFAGSAVLLAGAGAAMGAVHAAASGDAGQVARLTGGALAHLPAVWLVTAVALLLVGLAPHAATAASWSVVAVVVLITLFGQSLDWPAWVADLSPLNWTPTVPVESWQPGATIGLTAVTLALLAVAFGGFRRRDLVPG
jgi:ABC-2 type transport system permease protein